MAADVRSLDQRPESVRFNFVAGVLHGVFYRAGMAFSDPTSVLPVFLNQFTGSLTLIGVFSALIQGGGIFPLFFVAHWLEGRTRGKPILVAAIWIRAAAWGILGLLTFFWSGSDPTLVLVALLVLLFIFSFAGGVASIPFNAIWAKTLPATVRGRFFGHRQLWGGLMALGAAYVVKRVLGDKSLEFPNNYGILFLLSFIFLVVSYVSLSLVREPAGDTGKRKRRMEDFLRNSVRLIRQDSNLARLLLSRITIGFGSFALPFYVLYGRNDLHTPAEQVGVLLGAQVAGAIVSNLFWAQISDRIGNRTVIRLLGVIGVTIPVLALSSGVAGPWLLVPAFFLIGVHISGTGIGFTNYLLEIAPESTRPAYIAVAGTVGGLSFLWPILGGVVVDLWGYRATFAIAMAVVSLGLVFAARLGCVRPAGAHPSDPR